LQITANDQVNTSLWLPHRENSENCIAADE
jgi:hypothetical protein